MTGAKAELLNIPIFSELSKKEMKTVQRLMTELDVPEGKVLTTQGSPGREFMVIMDGTAKVQIDARTVAHLSQGDFLGELSVISGAPRTATVIATSPCRIQTLNRREFMALLDESPAISRKILLSAVKRLQNNQPITN